MDYMIILPLLASPTSHCVPSHLSQITSHHICVMRAGHGLYIAYHYPGVILEGEIPLSLAILTATLSRFYTFDVRRIHIGSKILGSTHSFT